MQPLANVVAAAAHAVEPRLDHQAERIGAVGEPRLDARVEADGAWEQEQGVGVRQSHSLEAAAITIPSLKTRQRVTLSFGGGDANFAGDCISGGARFRSRDAALCSGWEEERDAIETIEDYAGDPARLTAAELVSLGRPVVVRRVAADWPIVRAPDKAAYLRLFDSGAKTEMSVAAPEHKGRLFYTDGVAGLTFAREPATVSAVLDRLAGAAAASDPETIAAQAVSVAEALPGFTAENRLALLDAAIQPRIWIGNRVVTATHHDMFSNLAIVVAGRRRFTLFPPDQVANLYIGPFEFTPAGTPASLVDPEAPDLDLFPRAAEAMAHARAAELGPGDAIYIPHMWWHHVRSLDELSILVNYWWDEAPAPQPGLAPINALIHALLSFEGLPAEQRSAWRAMFDHFVFHASGDPNQHIPEERRGIRGVLTPESKTRLRRTLGQMMGR